MISRFWQKVSQTGNICECWIWTASLNDGYGRPQINGKHVYAHKYSYEHVFGPVPEGLQLDHLCRDRACVNPYHLEPVTTQENTKRGDQRKFAGCRQKAKTHCPSGHEYAGENLLVCGGKRYCRACNREKARRRALGLVGVA